LETHQNKCTYGKIRLVDDRGKSEYFVYNSLGYLITYTVEIDNVFSGCSYQYDYLGNVVAIGTFDSSATITNYANYDYDNYKRLLTDGTDWVGTDLIPRVYFNRIIDAIDGKIAVIKDNHDDPIADFSYDAQGNRVRKNGITYTLEGSIIIRETRSAAVYLEYFYDINGTVVGFSYYDTTSSLSGFYVYVNDLLGNIVGIVNQAGELVGEYRYDPFGNTTFIDGAIASINPFRYKSYYYDFETGYYYLNTRYYNPEVGRFIEMDSAKFLDTDSLSGLNLFIYCNNNPVMGYDPNGEFALTTLIIILCVVIGAIVGGLIAYDAATQSGKDGAEVVVLTLVGIVIGATVGYVVGVFLAPIAAASGTTTIGVGGAGALGISGGATITLSAAAVVDAVAVVATAAVGMVAMAFAKYCNSDGKMSVNRRQNAQFKYLCDKHGLNYNQRRQLHDYIIKRNLDLGYRELEDLIIKLFGK
jgi:RHS repeat-associated protein